MRSFHLVLLLVIIWALATTSFALDWWDEPYDSSYDGSYYRNLRYYQN